MTVRVGGQVVRNLKFFVVKNCMVKYLAGIDFIFRLGRATWDPKKVQLFINETAKSAKLETMYRPGTGMNRGRSCDVAVKDNVIVEPGKTCLYLFGFFAGSRKTLQLALCDLNLHTLLELVKPHNTCYLRPRISVSFRHLQVVRPPRTPTFDSHVVKNVWLNVWPNTRSEVWIIRRLPTHFQEMSLFTMHVVL